MRILFWTGTFWPQVGGVEVLAAKLLPALRERGYQFMVVTPQPRFSGPEETRYDGIPVHRIPFGIRHNNIAAVMEIRRRVARLKRRFAPDVVHINAVNASNFFHLITANVHPAPLLVTLHGAWSYEHDALVVHTLRAADWVVGCSAAILDKGRRLVPDIISRSSIVYNSLDLPAPLPEPLPLRAPRLLCLGRLVAEKGFDVALRAVADVTGRFPSARLTIAGHGPERERLEQQVVKLGITHLVDLVGEVFPQQVPSLMNSATLVVIPSRQESFSLVALEAALMARPVVATRVGGLAEVVVHEQTGLLVENEDSRALAQAIARLLDDPETAAQMGRAARSRARERFGWDRYVDAYDALYRKLVLDWYEKPLISQ